MKRFNCDFSSRFRILKGGKISLVVSALLGSVSLSFAAPSGGVVTSGSATISQSGNTTNITQSTSKATINWNSFSIASNETVNFNQPNVNSITLNRVIGNERSIIDGALNANGQVWILNSNGILFNSSAKINTAGIIATTKNISDADFNASKYKFNGGSSASVINMGEITASDSGYVAMLANTVQNDGTIKAYKGTVHLTGASEATINLNGNSIVSLTVNKGVLDALVENKNIIQADGGKIYLTTNAVDELLRGVVNNTGVIEAKSIDDMFSEVVLFAHGGMTNISGSIIADGGFVETSGKELQIESTTSIKAAHWLIDPENITIESTGGGDISGASIAANAIETYLSGTGSLTLQADNNINVNQAITWSSNTFTLNAGNNIYINQNLTATGTGALALFYGQSTVNGGTSRYTVADGIDVLIPSADKFTWKKGSGGTVTNLVLDNGNLKFGNGTESSINNMGSLLQPWYYDNVTSGRDGWFKLTFSSYPLDYAIGVGGDGTNAYNTNGDILSTNGYSSLSSAVSNLSINIAKYFEKTGTIAVTMDVNTPNNGIISTTNSYTLDNGANFLKAVTTVDNSTGADLNNMRLWIGTRDDYVGPNDRNYKTKGNIGANGFEPITIQTQEAKAIIVSEDTFTSGNGAAVLFYSTTPGTNTVIESCCSFSNVINLNPINSRISTPSAEDGSYGMFLSLGTLPNNQSGSVTWYYAAAPISQLESAVNQVGQSAGVTPSVPPTPSTPPAPEPTPTIDDSIQKVITTIVNSQQIKVEAPKIEFVQPVFAPAQTPIVSVIQIPTTNPSTGTVSTPLANIALKLGVAEGESVALVSTPVSGQQAERITLAEIAQIQPNSGGENTQGSNIEVQETRVALGGGSLVELVNGGVTLPEGVEQEFYVVKSNQRGTN